MEQGAVEKQILDQCRRMKMPVPDRIKNKPQISLGNEFYWQAYLDLSQDRSFGMAEGPIPWTATKLYAAHHGLPNDDFDDLWEVIKAMDVAYMKHREKRMKSQMGK